MCRMFLYLMIECVVKVWTGTEVPGSRLLSSLLPVYILYSRSQGSCKNRDGGVGRRREEGGGRREEEGRGLSQCKSEVS